MNIEIIKDYLQKNSSMSPQFIEYACQKMAHHQDVVADFCAWIRTGDFDFEPKAEVEGWTAKMLHEKFPFLSAADIFFSLSNLYDDPDGEKSLISAGYAIR